MAKVCFLAAIGGALVGGALAFLSGCSGSDDTCRPGLIQVGPGVCQVPRGDAGSGGTMTRTGTQTGEPGGILPPAGGRQSGVTGGRGGHSGGVDGGASGVGSAVSDSRGGGGGSLRAGSGGMAQAQAGASGRLTGGAGGREGEPDDEPEAGSGGSMAPPVAMAGKMSPPPPPPPPMHFCGDGTVDSGETCDGDCPASCDDRDPCTKDTKTGQPNQCNVECENTPITKVASGDKCCPPGASLKDDPDCPAKCGDGVISAGEQCDGNCRSDCNDADPCTDDVKTGSAPSCNVQCSNKPKADGASCGDGRVCKSGSCQDLPRTAWYSPCSTNADCNSGGVCAAGVCAKTCESISTVSSQCSGAPGGRPINCYHYAPDGICRVTCSRDADCPSGTACDWSVGLHGGGGGNPPGGCVAPAFVQIGEKPSTSGGKCGNGELDDGETCDNSSMQECPSCNDANPCTTDTFAGSAATCDISCKHAPIADCTT